MKLKSILAAAILVTTVSSSAFADTLNVCNIGARGGQCNDAPSANGRPNTISYAPMVIRGKYNCEFSVPAGHQKIKVERVSMVGGLFEAPGLEGAEIDGGRTLKVTVTKTAGENDRGLDVAFRVAQFSLRPIRLETFCDKAP